MAHNDGRRPIHKPYPGIIRKMNCALFYHDDQHHKVAVKTALERMETGTKETDPAVIYYRCSSHAGGETDLPVHERLLRCVLFECPARPEAATPGGIGGWITPWTCGVGKQASIGFCCTEKHEYSCRFWRHYDVQIRFQRGSGCVPKWCQGTGSVSASEGVQKYLAILTNEAEE